MKKVQFYSLVLTVALGCMFRVTNADASDRAKALFVQGNATYQLPGSESRVLASGDTLPERTRIVTGPNSSVDVAIGETVGSALKINANSRVGVTASDTVDIRVERGKVVLIVKELPAAGGVHIETSFAASSMTSIGGIIVSADGVEVLEGMPLKMQTNDGQTIMVEPGNGLRMSTDGSVSESYQVQNTSNYSDFKGQISDYRSGIQSAAEAPAAKTGKTETATEKSGKEQKTDEESQVDLSDAKTADTPINIPIPPDAASVP